VVVATLKTESGAALAATAGLVLLLGAGNASVWRAIARVETLTGQRRLGVAAVTLDAVVVLGAGLAADADAAATTFGALVIVVAEASVRFAPKKAMIATVILIASLGAAMAVRDVALDDPFDVIDFGVIALLALIAGTMIGSAVREVYRHRVGGPVTIEPESGMPETPHDVEAGLTPRERQVLSLIVRGYSNARIAEALVIEQKTVKNHINRIYGKLELSNRYEAITSVLGQRRFEE